MGTLFTRFLVIACTLALILPARWCCQFGCCTPPAHGAGESKPAPCCHCEEKQNNDPVKPAPSAPKPCCEVKPATPPNDYSFLVALTLAGLLPPVDAPPPAQTMP